MKKITVISACPKGPKSLGETILSESFTEDRDVEIINLYNFDIPFFKNEERAGEIVQQLFSKLEASDKWIFLFPIWWSNMPAILKNFFDWSIYYGVSYDKKSICTPALKGKNKKVVTICSSGDAYSKNNQKEIIGLINDNILKLWGVEVIGNVFMDNTYGLTENNYQDNKKEISLLLSQF